MKWLEMEGLFVNDFRQQLEGRSPYIPAWDRNLRRNISEQERPAHTACQGSLPLFRKSQLWLFS